MPMKKGAKRKATRKDEAPTTTNSVDSTAAAAVTADKEHKQEIKELTKVGRKPKRAKTETEPEFFDDQRELEDLWKQVFPVGTEWDDLLSEYKWNFSNLEDAFEEGGVLHGQKVYLFSCTEPQLLFYQGQSKVTCI